MGGWLLEVIGMAADTAVASSGGWVAADDRPVPVEMRFAGWREVSGVRFPTRRVIFFTAVSKGAK